jgi:hypothetical protein
VEAIAAMAVQIRACPPQPDEADAFLELRDPDDPLLP